MTRRELLVTSSRVFAGAVLSQGAAFADGAKPKQILIIRHAEKTGLKTDMHLNPRGFQRAAALPRLFPAQFDTPDFIFATRISKHSNRPVETVTPLAKALHRRIDNRFGEDDYRPLAKEVLSRPAYAGKNVLVCWHHGRIPALAEALGFSHPPSPWPDTQFDRVWRVQYDGGSATMTDMPQHLLEGDS
jgi:hypothetical protein